MEEMMWKRSGQENQTAWKNTEQIKDLRHGAVNREPLKIRNYKSCNGM